MSQAGAELWNPEAQLQAVKPSACSVLPMLTLRLAPLQRVAESVGCRRCRRQAKGEAQQKVAAAVRGELGHWPQEGALHGEGGGTARRWEHSEQVQANSPQWSRRASQAGTALGALGLLAYQLMQVTRHAAGSSMA